MDIDHLTSLMIVDEPNFLHWAHFEEQLADVPPLHSETDALVPLPESLDQFNNHFSTTESFCDNPLAALIPYDYHVTPTPKDVVHFDDIELDSFTWDDSLPPPLYEDLGNAVLPLKTITNLGNNTLSIPNEISNRSSGATPTWEKERTTEKRTSGRSRLSAMGFQEISHYFYMPITRAAREMNVGLTVLKKRCRELGISRWPHRKMKSLKSLIYNVQELGKGMAGHESIRSELEVLEEQKRLMEENPEVQLTDQTKKLRQACFKANYKKRRAMQSLYLDNHGAFFF